MATDGGDALRAILVNVGNTWCETGLLTGGTVRPVDRIATSALLAEHQTPAWLTGVPRLVLASVVPTATARFRDWLADRPTELLVVAAATVPWLDWSAVDASTVGADRVANVAAVVDLGLAPAVVIDFGTAITTEVVDADGRFLGGAILPGRRLARQALTTGTAQLPAVGLADTDLPCLGTTTRDAIRAGVDGGLVGAVRFLVDATCRRQPTIPFRRLGTGGDREFFLAHLPEIDAAPAQMTLLGLGAIARRAWRVTP